MDLSGFAAAAHAPSRLAVGPRLVDSGPPRPGSEEGMSEMSWTAGCADPNWPWVAIGLFGQGLFFTRFLFQWLASERLKRSVIPDASDRLRLTATVSP